MTRGTNISLRRGVIGATALLALAAVMHADDDASERRQALGRTGRLAWSENGKAVCVCNLDGTNEIESDSPPAAWLRWLPGGRHVIAVGGGRVIRIDPDTRHATDLTAGCAKTDRFVTSSPVVSSDGRRIIVWHADDGPFRTPKNKAYETPSKVVGYTVIDGETGKRFDIEPAAPVDWLGARPLAWWCADGTIAAVVETEPESIVRFSPDGAKLAVLATLAADERVTRAAFDGARLAYAVEGRGKLEVRGADGRAIFAADQSKMGCTRLAWMPDGTIEVETTARDAPHSSEIWSVPPGKAAVAAQPASRAPVAVAADGKWRVEHRPGASNWRLFRTGTDGETDLGPASDPRAFGDRVLFWRDAEQPGTIDLWACDPADGSVLRLTERAFRPRCWDICPAPRPETGK